MKSVSLFALLLLLLTSCQQTDELATPAESQKIGQRSQSARVFKATLQSSVNADPSIPLTQCSGDLPNFGIPDHFLAGQATHMGQLNPVMSTLHHDNCNLSFTTMTLTADVSGQLTASNGDVVYYSGEDVINVFNLLTGAGTTGTINGNWTITGGTGRFEDASGTFTINGMVDFVTGAFSAEAAGTITY